MLSIPDALKSIPDLPAKLVAGFEAIGKLPPKEEAEALGRALGKLGVGARYDRDYKITLEELQYLAERAVMQRALTEELCKKDIAKLQKLL